MERTAGASGSPGIGRRAWLVGALAVAVLVILAAVAVALTGTREDVAYDADSPEAAVQTYAAALTSGDTDSAWQLLSPRAQARLEEYEFRRAADWDEDLPTRVWVDERQGDADRVVLTLSVERSWDGLFGPDRDIQSLRLTLVRLDGEWHIDTPLVGFFPW